jgi:multiple sugar transport system substrate-binding protein
VPKKAVAIYFLAAFIGAALFVYFTFPRTKDEIPTSNNQRPFPSAPEPGPNGVPVPETVPHPNVPKVPPGPTLHVMAWAGGNEARALETETDAFTAATGRNVSLTIAANPADYRRDLQGALASATPPDVCLIDARDFSGLDPARDLTAAAALPDTAPRCVSAFTVHDELKAVPGEFSVNLLFYNTALFDQAGIGYPDRHWNWDVLESITRAITSLKLTDASGQPIYAIELPPANFDFWNVLSAQAGHAALDLDAWHLADTESRDSQIRALDFIREYSQELAVAAPPPKAGEAPGRLFAEQRAALLIAPSELDALLPGFRYGFTLPPGDIARASLARVNGWAVPAKSPEQEAAHALAAYLAVQPVHAGWSPVVPPSEPDAHNAICYEALGQAIIPRIEPKAVPLAQFLDQQIALVARSSTQRTDSVYDLILSKYKGGAPDHPVDGDESQDAAGLQPALIGPAAPQLRGP